MFYFRMISYISAAITSIIITVAGANADSFMLDYGNVVASGQQITITRLPIVKGNGKTTYKDVIVKFKLNSKSKFVVAKGFPKTTNSKNIGSAKLIAGKYKLNNTIYIYDLVGPGVGPNGRSIWTLVGDNNRSDMTFYAGPVKGHPLQARIKATGVSSSPFTYGYSSDGTGLNAYFSDGCLVSAHMISGDLKLNSHSNTSCTIDQKIPTKTFALKICKNDKCP